MFKLDLEKAEEPEIKLPTSAGSWKKQESSRTTSISALLTMNFIYLFLELSCFFNDPTDVGNLISGSSAFSKSSLNIWKFMVHVLLKPDLKNFEHYFISV